MPKPTMRTRVRGDLNLERKRKLEQYLVLLSVKMVVAAKTVVTAEASCVGRRSKRNASQAMAVEAAKMTCVGRLFTPTRAPRGSGITNYSTR